MTIFPRYVSSRFKDLKVGISSYSEDRTALEVIGNVGVGTTNPNVAVGAANTAKFAAGIVTAHNIYANRYHGDDNFNFYAGKNAGSGTVGILSGAVGNIGIGESAGAQITSGICNVIIGARAGCELTTGYLNVVMGWNAMRHSTSAINNVAIGIKAGRNLTTGGCNIFLGRNAGTGVTDATRNIAIGNDVLMSSLGSGIGGCSNIMLGDQVAFALGYTKDRDAFKSNIMIGKGAAGFSQYSQGNSSTGCTHASEVKRNIFIGECSAYFMSPQIPGYDRFVDNVFLGSYTGCKFAGENNVFLGSSVNRRSGAGVTFSAGCQNIGIGYSVCLPKQIGNRQLAIGHSDFQWIHGDSNYNVGIGITDPSNAVTSSDTQKLAAGIVTAYNVFASQYRGDQNNNFYAGAFVGSGAAGITSGATFNIGIGQSSGYNLTTGKCNILIGHCVGIALSTTCNSILIGSCAGKNVHASESILIGNRAGCDLKFAGTNIAIGYRVFRGKIGGGSNIAIGQEAGREDNPTVTNLNSANISVGYQAGRTLAAGRCNINIGYKAGENNFSATGVCSNSDNVYIGTRAGNSVGYLNYQGCDISCNVAIGHRAGESMNYGPSNAANQNVLVGHYAFHQGRGACNIFIGPFAGYGHGGFHHCSKTHPQLYGDRNIGIGHSVTMPSDFGSNQLAIGQTSQYWITGDQSFNVGIGSTQPQGKLDVGGTIFADQFNISGVSSFVGVVTTSNDLFVGGNLSLKDDKFIKLGNENDFDIRHSSAANSTFISQKDIAPGTQLIISSPSLTLQSASSPKYFMADTNTRLYHPIVGTAGRSVLETNGIGVTIYNQLDTTDLNVTGIITSTGVDINGDLDVDGQTDLDVLNVAETATFSALVDVNNRLDVVGGANIDQLNVAGITTFGGNVSIAGTLTYEDVTNVDSVGIITAGHGLRVTKGGINVSGISTFKDDVDFVGVPVGIAQTSIQFHKGDGTNSDLDVLRFYDSASASFGVGHTGGLTIRGNYNSTGASPTFNSFILASGDNFFIDGGTSTSIKIRTQFARNAIIANSDNGGSGTVELYHSSGGTATKKFETSGLGVTVYGTVDATQLNASGVGTFNGRVGINTTILRSVPALDVNLPQDFSSQPSILGVGGVAIGNTGNKTYPNISGFRATLGLRQKIEIGGTQTIDSSSPGGYPEIHGMTNFLVKANGNVQNIERTQYVGFSNQTQWIDQNTVRQYKGIQDDFSYYGKNANGKTTSYLEAKAIYIRPEGGSVQTIQNVRSSVLDIRTSATSSGIATVNINDTWMGSRSTLRILPGAGQTVKGFIKNATFFAAGNQYWGTSGSGGKDVTIENLRGLHLRAPSAFDGITVSNNYGVYQDWSNASNYFAGNVGVGTTIATNAVSVNNTAKLAVGIATAHQVFAQIFSGTSGSETGGTYTGGNVAFGNTFTGNTLDTTSCLSNYNNISIGNCTGCRLNGNSNIILGEKAGNNVTTGKNNIIMGRNVASTFVDLTGNNNIIMGQGSGAYMTSARNNIIMGENTTGSFQTGYENVLIGCRVAEQLSNGISNVFLGPRAGYGVTNGCCNVFIGSRARPTESDVSNCLVIGGLSKSWLYGDSNYSVGIGITNPTVAVVGAGSTQKLAAGIVTAHNVFANRYQGDENRNFFAGEFAGSTGTFNNTAACLNVAIGNSAGSNLNASGSHVAQKNVYIGNCAAIAATTSCYNTVVGADAGIGMTSHSSYSNVLLGFCAGRCIQGARNIAIGQVSLDRVSTGYGNIGIGYKAGRNAAGNTVSNNISIGQLAGDGSFVGNKNLFLGHYAGRNLLAPAGNNSLCNVFVGSDAFNGAYAGGLFCENTVVGNRAGARAEGIGITTNLSFNVFLGSCAGCYTKGSCNIFIGPRAASGISARRHEGISNIGIGQSIQMPNRFGSNQLAIGQTSQYWITGDESFNVGIGTTTPSGKLQVVGDTVVDTLKVGTGLTITKTNDTLTTFHNNSASVQHILEPSNDKEIWTSEVSIGATNYFVPQFRINRNGPVEAYYKFGGIKLRTSGLGVTVYGQLDTTDLNVAGIATFANNVHVVGKNILIAKGSANDAAANTGGITVASGQGDKTWQYISGNDSWSSSETIRVADDKLYGWVDDTNTYIARPSADTISFETGGSERFNISNSGVNVIGIATFANNVDINGELDVDGHTNLDNTSIVGFVTITANNSSDGRLKIEGATQGQKIHLHRANTASVAIRYQNNHGSLYAGLGDGFSNDQRFVIGKSGTLSNNPILQASEQLNVIVGTAVTFSGTTGNATYTGIITATGLDINGHTELDNLSIVGVTTFAGAIDANNGLDVVGGSTLDNLNVSGVGTFSRIFLPDNHKAQFGNAAGNADLEIYHDGNHNIFKANNGFVKFYNNVFQVYNQGGNNVAFEVVPGSFTKLYHGTTQRLLTTSSGVDLNGTLSVSGISTFSDTVKIGTGVTALTDGNVSIGGTLELFNTTGNASNNPSEIKLSTFSIGQHNNVGTMKIMNNNATGSLIIGAGGGGYGGITFFNKNLNAKYLDARDQAFVSLYYNNTVRFSTSGIGATVYGQLDTTDLNVSGVSTFAGITTHIDTLHAQTLNVAGVSTFHSRIKAFGRIDIGSTTSTGQVRISNGSSHVFTVGNIGGNLTLRSANGAVQADDNIGRKLFFGSPGGAFRIYHGGGQKLTTKGTGINVTGEVESDGLVVDGDSDLNGDLNVTGVSTLTGDVTLVGSVNQINVTGVSTFSSLVDVNNRLDVAGGANVDQLNVTGVSTHVGVTTFKSRVFIGAATTAEARLNIGNDIEIYSSGQVARFRIPESSPHGILTFLDQPVLQIGRGATEYATFNSSQARFKVDNKLRLNVVSDGIEVSGVTDTLGLNVTAGVSTFADDIFVGTGATVGFGSTAYFNHNVVVASDKSLSIGGKLSTRYISAINSVFQTNTADQFISVSDSFTLQALNGKKFFKAGISADTGLYHQGTQKLGTNVNGISILNNASGSLGTMTALNVDTTFLNVSGISTFGGDLNIAENIIHTGDTDTKISFPSNDTIKLETASNTITVDNSKTTFGRPIRVGDYIAHSGVDSLGVKFFNQGTGNNNTFIGLGAEDHGTSGGINHKTFQVFRQGSSVNRVFIDNFGNLRARQGFTVAGVSTFAGLVDINAGGQANTFKVEDLTSGRVVLAGTGGELEDSANLTFNGSTLGVTGDASFSGNVSVGGTLTYEDVTNVDSVGIITAGKGVRITEGGLNVTAGVSTFRGINNISGEVNIGDSATGQTTNRLRIGDDTDIQIYHDSSTTNNHFIAQNGLFYLQNDNLRITAANTSKPFIRADVDSHVKLYYASNEKFATSGIGATVFGQLDTTDLNVAGVSTFANTIDANGTLSVLGHTVLRDVAVTGFTTFFPTGGTKFFTTIEAQNGMFVHNSGVSTYKTPVQIDAGATLNQLNVSGVSTFAGDVSIAQNLVHTGDEHTKLQFNSDAILLNTAGTTRISASATEVNVTSTLKASKTGTNAGIRIHNGGISATDNELRFNTGQTNGFSFNTNSDGTSSNERLRITADGKVQVGTGVTIEGNGQANFVGVVTFNEARFANDKRLKFGDDIDLQIYHLNATNNNFISAANNSDLTISAREVELMNQNHSSYYFKGAETGSIVYHNNAQRLATNGVGVTIYNQLDTTHLNVSGVSTFAGLIDGNGGANIVGGLTLDNLNVSGVGTLSGQLFVGGVEITGGASIGQDITTRHLRATGITTFQDDVEFHGADGVEIFFDKSDKSFKFIDNAKLKIGSSPHLELYHDGTDSYIDNNTGDLYLQTTGSGDDILIESADDFFIKTNGTQRVKIEQTGEIKLGSGGDLATHVGSRERVAILGSSSNGSMLHIRGGSPAIFFDQSGGNISKIYQDNVNLAFHAGTPALEGTNTFLLTSAGNATFAGNLTANGNLDVDGHTNLDNVNVVGVSTFTGAIDANGDLNVSGVSTFGGKVTLNVGASSLMQLYFQNNITGFGANDGAAVSYSTNSNSMFFSAFETAGNMVFQTGANNLNNRTLLISNTGVVTLQRNQKNMLVATPNSHVKLYYNDTERLSTSGIGITVTGEADVNGDLDVDGHTNLNNLSISGVSTFTSDINANGNIVGDTSTDITGINTVGANFYFGCGGEGSRLFQNDSKGNFIAGTCAGLALTVPGNNCENILIGRCAGRSVATSCYNVIIGNRAACCVSTGSGQQVIIGQCAGNRLGQEGGSQAGNVFLGAHAGKNGINQQYNIAIGFQAGCTNEGCTGGSCNIAIGFRSGCSQKSDTNNNVFIGRATGMSNSSGKKNTFFNNTSGMCNISGSANFAGGYATLQQNTTGNSNVAIGDQAGKCNLTGGRNVFIGNLTGHQNTTGMGNVAIECGALRCNVSGTFNIAIGNNAGRNNISGNCNIYLGESAGLSNTTGVCNIALGSQAMYCSICGGSNIAIGEHASRCSKANLNIAIGRRANQNNNESGVSQLNLAIGDCALYGGNGGSGSCGNIAFGVAAGLSHTSGLGNIFIGCCAGKSSSCTSHNINIGSFAGCANTTGKCNVLIGRLAGQNGNATLNTIVGDAAGQGAGGGCNAIFGSCAGCGLSSGEYNIAFGAGAGKKLHTGSCNIAIGNITAAFNNVTGTHNIMMGNRAGSRLTSGSQNTFLGSSAGRYVTSGARNFVAGTQSSYCLTLGNDNIGIGACTNRCLTIGSDNIAIGRCANYSDTNTWGNIAIGHSAGYHANATNYRENISIGSTAGGGGACNIAIGRYALSNCATTGGYNIAIGGEAGCSISYGDHNVFIGASAGAGSEGGDCNIGIGVNAGRCNRDGHRNISIGFMSNFCSEHSMCNVAVGHQAQFKIETASHNVALGNQAARCLETSHGNVSIGQSAAYGLKGGSNNVSIGSSSGPGSCLGNDGATGDDNIYIGKFSGTNITTGHTNVFLGPYAGRASASSSANNNIGIGMNVGKCLTTGFNNIFFGKNAGAANTGGKANIFMGLLSGNANAGGSNNHFIGGVSGMSNVTGKQNNFFGFYAGAGNISGNYNIFFGTAAAINNTTGSCTIAIGHHAARCQTTANATIAIGHCAGAGNTITGSDNVLVGRSAGFAITTAFNNIFMGVCAGANTGIGTENTFIGSCAGLCTTDGKRSVFIGPNAGKCFTTGQVNIAIGPEAGCAFTNNNTNTVIGNASGKKLCSGSGNTLYGNNAGCAINTGGCNTVVGRDAGKQITSGSHNNIFGHFAGCKLSQGSSNLLMGNCAGYCVCGNSNVMLGRSSGFHRTGTKYDRNVLVGQSAGSSAGTLAVGNYDVLIGFNAGCNYTGSCSIGIGHSVCLPIADGMNQLAIGHYEDRWIVGTCDFNVGIGITTPTSKLHVGGDAVVSGVVTATDFDATSDIRLKTNIKPIDDPIAKVIQIEGVSFNWKKDNQPALGVIADQVEKILPELVHGDDPKTVNYNGLIGLLIEVVKDQQNQINTLSERISKLE